MSYNKDYNNIIGQYDGSTISERTGIQIGLGLGKGTVNLTNGSATGTVNNVTITNNVSDGDIGYDTNKFNIFGTGVSKISVIDNLTGDVYNLSINYVSSTSFTISACGKLSYTTETHSLTTTFSGTTGTYEYYIGHKALVKYNSIYLGVNRITGINLIPVVSGISSIIISNGGFTSGDILTGNNSLMFGSGSIIGGNSMVLGKGYASGDDSIAIGTSAIAGDASGSESIAIAATASGIQSVAIMGATASGNTSFAIMGGNAVGTQTLALGPGTATSNYSIVISTKTTVAARGDSSVIISGYNNTANISYSSGQGSIVLGLSRNSGSILGVMSTADKYSSMLGGNDNYIGVNGNTTTNSTYNSSIIASQASGIYQSSTTDTSLMIHTMILGGNNNTIRSLANLSSLRTSNILVSENSTITNNTGAQVINNCLLNTNNVTLQNTNNTTVIGQTTTTTITESDIVYIGKEIVGGKVATTVLSAALSNTSSTVYSNIISFNAKAGAVYRLRLIGTYQTAATTTGIKVRMSGTAVANVTGYITGAITAVTGATSLRATIASMTAELITTGVSAINTPHAIDGDIIVRCTTAGTVILQMASEVNASAAQLNIGTAVIVERVI